MGWIESKFQILNSNFGAKRIVGNIRVYWEPSAFLARAILIGRNMPVVRRDNTATVAKWVLLISLVWHLSTGLQLSSIYCTSNKDDVATSPRYRSPIFREQSCSSLDSKYCSIAEHNYDWGEFPTMHSICRTSASVNCAFCCNQEHSIDAEVPMMYCCIHEPQSQSADCLG